jgi:tRNA threonylcarbamoyl adenosine modification protein YeaZ
MNYQEFLTNHKTFYVLSLDTSTRWIICSFFKIDFESTSNFSITTLYQKEEEGIRNSFQKLSLYLKEVLLYKKPDLILCGTGPGSFTGVRISVTTARTLSQVYRIPIIAIDSLSLYSYSIYRQENIDHFLIGFDGKQKKYYTKEFNQDMLLNPISDISKNEILHTIENNVLFLDNKEPLISWLNEKEKLLYQHKINLITSVSSRFWIDLILSEKFINNSDNFFYENYKNVIPLYIRKDPAHEKYPEGLARI